MDKISILYLFADPDPDLVLTVDERLMLNVEDAEYPHFQHVNKWGKKTYHAQAYLVAPSGEKILVQVRPKNNKVQHSIRLEFNPTKLGPAGLAFLKDQLDDLSLFSVSFDDLLAHGRVSRADVAVDAVGVRTDQLNIEYSGGGKSHWYFDGKHIPQTGYFGLHKTVKDKSAPLTVYNKRQQLKATNQLPQYGGVSHTRIEYRAKVNRLVPDLISMPNPLLELSVANAACFIPEGVVPWQWKVFLDSCQRRGRAGALAIVDHPGTRLQYEAALETAHKAFWKPDLLWQYWPDALKLSGLPTAPPAAKNVESELSGP